VTKYLFFCGKGETQTAALKEALMQCSEVMVNFPSLVVELVEMTPNASGYDSHLRVMAISDNIDTKGIKSDTKTSASSEIKPSDDLGRREGVELESGTATGNTKFVTMMSFDLAVKDGAIPDIPTQDIDQFKGLGYSVAEVRNYLDNRQRQFQSRLQNNLN
jgi:hypothetical protein